MKWTQAHFPSSDVHTLMCTSDFLFGPAQTFSAVARQLAGRPKSALIAVVEVPQLLRDQ